MSGFESISKETPQIKEITSFLESIDLEKIPNIQTRLSHASDCIFAEGQRLVEAEIEKNPDILKNYLIAVQYLTSRDKVLRIWNDLIRKKYLDENTAINALTVKTYSQTLGKIPEISGDITKLVKNYDQVNDCAAKLDSLLNLVADKDNTQQYEEYFNSFAAYYTFRAKSIAVPVYETTTKADKLKLLMSIFLSTNFGLNNNKISDISPEVFNLKKELVVSIENQQFNIEFVMYKVYVAITNLLSHAFDDPKKSGGLYDVFFDFTKDIQAGISTLYGNDHEESKLTRTKLEAIKQSFNQKRVYFRNLFEKELETTSNISNNSFLKAFINLLSEPLPDIPQEQDLLETPPNENRQDLIIDKEVNQTELEPKTAIKDKIDSAFIIDFINKHSQYFSVKNSFIKGLEKISLSAQLDNLYEFLNILLKEFETSPVNTHILKKVAINSMLPGSNQITRRLQRKQNYMVSGSRIDTWQCRINDALRVSMKWNEEEGKIELVFFNNPRGHQ